MPSPSVDEKKIIISFRDGKLLKGYLSCAGYPDLASLLESSRQGVPRVITVSSVEDRSPVEVALGGIKAIFFVKSFDGDKARKDLHFYASGPEVGDIWVEVHFKDHEIMEGTIHNSVRHLVEPGFFLNPSDLAGNNLLVYVNKDAILYYRVLGVRTTSSARQNHV